MYFPIFTRMTLYDVALITRSAIVRLHVTRRDKCRAIKIFAGTPFTLAEPTTAFRYSLLRDFVAKSITRVN